jgi:hypothetical protein
VGGELGVDHVGGGQQAGGAGQVAEVGVRLAGEHRVAGLAVHLGALDLAVPVGALHQAHHDAAAGQAGQLRQVVDDPRGALLVGLHHHAQAVPAGQRGLGGEPLDEIEGEFQPLGLLGVDVEADPVVAGQPGQGQQTRVELGQHPLPLGPAVTRVERRQLHRDARPGHHAALPEPPMAWIAA